MPACGVEMAQAGTGISTLLVCLAADQGINYSSLGLRSCSTRPCLGNSFLLDREKYCNIILGILSPKVPKNLRFKNSFRQMVSMHFKTPSVSLILTCLVFPQTSVSF